MGRVCAVLTAVGRWAGFVLFWLQWGDEQGLCCSDCSGEMVRVCAVLTAVGRWGDGQGLCCSDCSGEMGRISAVPSAVRSSSHH